MRSCPSGKHSRLAQSIQKRLYQRGERVHRWPEDVVLVPENVDAEFNLGNSAGEPRWLNDGQLQCGGE
jgi:hypothetical protein